jgi:tetratricopeptide (TPR) repeat protein
MSLQDSLPITLSAVSLVLSVISGIYTFFTKKYETQRTIRFQLSDVFERIFSNDLESIKVAQQAGLGDSYRQAQGAQFNQQRYFLLHQAMRLADQIEELVTDVEYNTIAYTCGNVGDLVNADKFYRRAIGSTPTVVAKVLAIQSYANFLFFQHRFEEGRKQFDEATRLITGGDNVARSIRGSVYQAWAVAELLAKSPARAEPLKESARSEFSGIDLEFQKQQLLSSFDNAIRSASLPAAPENSVKGKT